jgi:hypothetical protein
MRREQLKRTILVGAISVSIALSSIGAFAINKSPIARLLIRDVVVTTIAYHKAGEKIIADSDPSTFVMEYSQVIVPFFAQEKIREMPISPEKITIILDESGGISGVAIPEDNTIRLTFIEQVDIRELLPVIVHELVHLQRGRFLTYDEQPPWIKFTSSEANTQAATLEVLAAMCNSGDDLACATFWNEVGEYSNSVFWFHLEQNGLEEWYQPINELFWVGSSDFQSAPIEVSYAYFQYPWEQIIIPGIMGESLDTGNVYNHEISDGNFVCKRLLMPFDDTEELLGWLDRFIEWITPE